jgi:hypothetical protein
MKFALLVLLAIGGFMPCQAQIGKFFGGYTGTDHGVQIELRIVRSGPRCREDNSCPWMVIWSSKKAAKTVEISVTAAGFDFPVAVASVPGGIAAKKDLRHPVFTVPLSTVHQIDFILFNGTKEVGEATFK